MRRFLSALLIVIFALPLFATEPNPSLRQRELIEKLLDAMHMDANAILDAVFAQIEKQFLEAAAAKGNDPDDIAEAREMFAMFRERSVSIDVAGILRDAQVHIYAKYFTEQELVDLTTFYTSPAGRKAIDVMPQLMREGMEAGEQHLGPKIAEVMTLVQEAQEKKRPWRRTMSDISRVNTALEAYVTDTEEGYPQGDYDSLKALLSPAYITKFPEKDIWGHPYAYAASTDGQHYRIVSAGADGIFEWDSRTIAVLKDGVESPVRYRDRLEDDVIYSDGLFLQLPLQAKPKHED